jgi:hypothetical protein
MVVAKVVRLFDNRVHRLNQNMELGQKITVGHFLSRKKERAPSNNYHADNYKRWEARPLDKKIEVMVIGKRYLQNGITCREDGVRYFVAKERFLAWLVVESLHRKPFLISDEPVLIPSTEIL